MWEKSKKIAGYVLAGIGALAILWIAASYLLYGSDVTSKGYSLSGVAPAMMGGGADSGVLSGLANLYNRDQAAYEKSVSSAAPSAGSGVSEGTLTQRKVIRDGNLSLLVKKAEEASQKIQEVALTMNGFISQANVYEVSAGAKAGTVTIRVPADRFSEAMESVKKLAVKVERETQTAQDVTEQFVDLESQLKNLQAVEAQYLEIIKKADKVPDIMQVQQQLNEVRMRIDSIQGQVKYLSRQVDMSSITANLTEEADVEVFGIRWRPLYVIKQSFRGMLTKMTGFADSVIALVFALPVIILWLLLIALIVWVVWKVANWGKRRFFRQQQP